MPMIEVENNNLNTMVSSLQLSFHTEGHDGDVLLVLTDAKSEYARPYLELIIDADNLEQLRDELADAIDDAFRNSRPEPETGRMKKPKKDLQP